ncbi:hypothetical protein PCANC_06774, partial [Puccinia coronata f. sp. avenae]
VVLRLVAGTTDHNERLPTGIGRLDTEPTTFIIRRDGEDRQIIQKQRRGVALAGHHPYPREVTCRPPTDDQLETFKSKDCLLAAKKISAHHLRELTCNTCKLSVINNEGELIPSTLPADHLRHMTVKFLESCASHKFINGQWDQLQIKDVWTEITAIGALTGLALPARCFSGSV